MKTNMLLVAAWLSAISAFAIEKQSKMVLFETDKHELDKSAFQVLDSLVQFAKKCDDFEIRVWGHTDDVGSQQYNKELSKRRADAVKKYLVSKGIEEGIVVADFFGESRLLKKNFDAKSRQVNRRVEVELTHFVFESMDELDSLLKSRNRLYFVVNPNCKTVLTGKSGTKILVNKTSFVDAEGKPIDEAVELQLIEAVSKDQFLSNNLLTISNGKLLESGGMLNLQLETASGKQVSINPNDPLIVQLPAEQKFEDMLYFTSTTGQDWQTQNLLISKSYDKLVRPVFKKYSFEEPTYKSKIKTPIKPTHPTQPRKPNAPREELYKVETGFLGFLLKDKLEAEAQARYNDAYAKYLERYQKYESRLEQYKKALIQYYDDLAKYEDDVKSYPMRCELERMEFMKSDKYAEYNRLNDSLYEVAQKKYAQELEIYQKEKQRQLFEWAKNVDDLGVNSSIGLTTSYVFHANTLNWINCDRFYNSPMQEIEVISNFDGKKDDLRAYVIFDQINSITNSFTERQNNKYKLSVPIDEPSHFFAYGINKKGQTVLFKNSLSQNTTDKSKPLVLTPRVCKFSEIVGAMQSFS